MTDNEKELMPCPFDKDELLKAMNRLPLNGIVLNYICWLEEQKNTRPQPSADVNDYNSKLQSDLMNIAKPFMDLPRGKTITPDMALETIRQALTQPPKGHDA